VSHSRDGRLWTGSCYQAHTSRAIRRTIVVLSGAVPYRAIKLKSSCYQAHEVK
jgi:hypothetical protein